MKKPALLPSAGRSGGAVESSIPQLDHCPNTPDCQRWGSQDGGVFCRLCWAVYTDPEPVTVTERRA